MEQLVARWAHNPKVVGSSPAPATKRKADSRESAFSFIFSQTSTSKNTIQFQDLGLFLPSFS